MDSGEAERDGEAKEWGIMEDSSGYDTAVGRVGWRCTD